MCAFQGTIETFRRLQRMQVGEMEVFRDKLHCDSSKSRRFGAEARLGLIVRVYPTGRYF